MNVEKEFEIKVLLPGFSRLNGNVMEANCTCTLIKGPQNIIIDTRTAWDGAAIVESLNNVGLSPNDINYVICTHGHSDHVGCNYLFTKAIHIVGFSISKGETYMLSPDFSNEEEYVINQNIKVIPTPGHTLQDVSVIFKDKNNLVYAIVGDLFENENDLLNELIWINAGSDNIELQRHNRLKIMDIADYIIPGHGAMFPVNK
ncbi:metallo-beta-lactamase domain-containing protein 1 [Sitophilus oryzae]|uniref:Metallo-beta-lactamase domain-containing protein 1 n=1 Tax=Sitophilus oryzae TaxID=7048 RepID=A0A6J2YDN5_SITOR|nr:metallo-beta-lactamase domain-containing protein 1 [Sitophilus oryzae]